MYSTRRSTQRGQHSIRRGAGSMGSTGSEGSEGSEGGEGGSALGNAAGVCPGRRRAFGTLVRHGKPDRRGGVGGPKGRRFRGSGGGGAFPALFREAREKLKKNENGRAGNFPVGSVLVFRQIKTGSKRNKELKRT